MVRSLFIGRYQPFHEGHKKLIQTVIDEGKKPVIAIRDTDIDENNPYTAAERVWMIRDVFGYKKVDTIIIPDVTEVCYGRNVGWKIRQIRLDEETENISATKIRNAAL